MKAKPAHWFVNAGRRTLLAAFPRLVRPDDAWALAQLEPAEARLFLQLPPQERAHGVEVARRLLRESPSADSVLLRAALLHDVGKLGAPNHVLWRVLAHLLPQADHPAEPRLRGLAGARQARRHHPAYGAELIREAAAAAGDGSSEAVAKLVEQHHDAGATGAALLLRAADERT